MSFESPRPESRPRRTGWFDSPPTSPASSFFPVSPQIPHMSDSTSSPPTSTATPPLFLPPAHLRPPRPPRLRPPSRDSNTSNANSGTWTELTLGASFDYLLDKRPTTGTTQKSFMDASFIDMRKVPDETVSPARVMGSPTLGVGDALSPPPNDRDPAKKSTETRSVYSVHSNGSAPPSHPANSRSTLRSVFLVLSCAGSMIINVSALCFRRSWPRGIDSSLV